MVSVCKVSVIFVLTSVDDLAAIEVCQAVEDAFSHLPEDLLASPPAELLDFAVNRIKTAAFTKLHCDRYRARRLVHERTIV